jgi:hypothetical protein
VNRFVGLNNTPEMRTFHVLLCVFKRLIIVKTLVKAKSSSLNSNLIIGKLSEGFLFSAAFEVTEICSDFQGFL